MADPQSKNFTSSNSIRTAWVISPRRLSSRLVMANRGWWARRGPGISPALRRAQPDDRRSARATAPAQLASDRHGGAEESSARQRSHLAAARHRWPEQVLRRDRRRLLRLHRRVAPVVAV